MFARMASGNRIFITISKEIDIKQGSLQALSFNDLAPLLQSPFNRERFSAIAEYKYIIVDLKHITAGHHSQVQIIKQLRQLPCPCIGITDNPDPIPADILNTFDVIVDHQNKTRPLITNIEQNPIAAMTLVQLIRHSESLEIYDGILAESLAYASLQGGAEAKAFLEKQPGTGLPVINEPEPAVLIHREDKQLHLTLNRPEHLNAYSIAMRDDLINGLQLLADDDSITKAILNGKGDCFSIGGDLAEFGTAPDTATAHAVRSTRNAGLLMSQLSDRIECHVHRACIGSGIELPAFTHKIIATADTFFQLPEITMGLIPGAGGTVSITRRIGRQRMVWWALSAKKINAKTALEWGLIDGIM